MLGNNERIKNAGKALALIGAFLQLGPLFGLLGTVVGMLRTFRSLALGEGRTTDDVAEGISTALVTTQIGLVLGLIGTVFLAIALFGCKYRARWFFWFLVFSAVMSLLAFPIGTVFGLLLLAYVLTKKGEFSETENHGITT